jgi:CBS domain-containing membrane protein
VAACLGILLMQGILAVWPGEPGISYLLAPLGATTVILFALPHSPLAQPWSLAGGLLISALIGYGCGLVVQPAWLAIGVALGVHLGHRAAALHPPAGWRHGHAVRHRRPGSQGFAAHCPAQRGAALVAVLAVNNLLPGRRYPQCVPARQPMVRAPRRSVGHHDLQYAIEQLDTYLDISEDDLVSIYDLATAHAHRRHERRTCAEAMNPAPISVEYATELNEAWALMQTHHLHGVPVVDRAQRVIGVLTLENFLRHVEADGGQRIGDNIRRLLRPTPTVHSDKPEVAGQIMSLNFALATTRRRRSAR